MLSIFCLAPPRASQLGTNAINIAYYFIEISIRI